MVFFAAGCNQTPADQQISGHSLTIGNHKVNIEIAADEESRNLGLGGRHILDPNDGMLFVFDSPSEYSFWMKGMHFDLDFIWIKDGHVVEITSNVPAEPNAAESALKIYKPAVSVNQVLEVNAGWSERNQIKIGDSATVDQ